MYVFRTHSRVLSMVCARVSTSYAYSLGKKKAARGLPAWMVSRAPAESSTVRLPQCRLQFTRLLQAKISALDVLVMGGCTANAVFLFLGVDDILPIADISPQNVYITQLFSFHFILTSDDKNWNCDTIVPYGRPEGGPANCSIELET